jgi:hypothetical protein
MNSEFETETNEILDCISQEIIETNILPKDLCYIISEYTISFYEVVKCSNNLMASTNLIYLSLDDFHPEIKHIKIENFIYNIDYVSDIKKNQIALNIYHRQNSKVYSNQSMFVNLSQYNIPELLEIYITLSKPSYKTEYRYNLHDDFIKIKNDKTEFCRSFVNSFKGQIFGVGQYVYMFYNKNPFEIKIDKVYQNKKRRYTLSSDFNGLLTENIQNIYVDIKSD